MSSMAARLLSIAMILVILIASVEAATEVPKTFEINCGGLVKVKDGRVVSVEFDQPLSERKVDWMKSVVLAVYPPLEFFQNADSNTAYLIGDEKQFTRYTTMFDELEEYYFEIGKAIYNKGVLETWDTKVEKKYKLTGEDSGLYRSETIKTHSRYRFKKRVGQVRNGRSEWVIDNENTYDCETKERLNGSWRTKKDIRQSTYPDGRYYISETSSFGGEDTYPAGDDSEGEWFSGRFLRVDQKIGRSSGNAVERLDRYLVSIEKALEAKKYDTALRQARTLSGHVEDLRRTLAKDKAKGKVRVARLPTQSTVNQIFELRTTFEELKTVRLEAVERADRINQDLLQLKTQFTANVVKGMLRNYLSWTGMAPTSPKEGFAGYSLNTQIFQIPLTFTEWATVAQEDAGVLSLQIHTIRQLERFQAFWENVRENATQECRRIVELLDENRADEILSLHRELIGLFKKRI